MFEQKDRNKEDWEQLQRQKEHLSMLSNQVQSQVQAQTWIPNEQSQQSAQQSVNQTIVEEQSVQSVPSPEQIITELLKNDENMKQHL